jgi:phospholipid/cholesterol/gamma-HCH transport system permease protein
MYMPFFLRNFIKETGEIAGFTARFFVEAFRPPYEFREFLRQSFYIGYRSLPLVGVTAFIIGLVITIQTRPTLVELGAESWLPKMVSISLIREIAPVITALICAGKIGSGIGAELGSMKVTEQIDAMEVSGTNPFNFLIITRVFACTLMIPMLAIFADAISLYGGFLGANIKGMVSWNLYWNQVFVTLEYSDFLPAFVKTFFFGFAIGIIGCFKGFATSDGTEGVGRSANLAVVTSSLLVFIIDLVAVRVAELLNIT